MSLGTPTERPKMRPKGGAGHAELHGTCNKSRPGGFPLTPPGARPIKPHKTLGTFHFVHKARWRMYMCVCVCIYAANFQFLTFWVREGRLGRCRKNMASCLSNKLGPVFHGKITFKTNVRRHRKTCVFRLEFHSHSSHGKMQEYGHAQFEKQCRLAIAADSMSIADVHQRVHNKKI